MIISGGSRSNWRFFSKHLTNAKDNERVQLIEVRGLAGDDVQEAFREMDALASGTRCKNFFYHADINPRADERLTPEEWERAVDVLESNLGLEGHSRFVVEHEKEGRTHRHIIWSRIDPDTMTAISDSLNFAKHERAARALEIEFEHEAVRNALTRDTKEPRPDRRPQNWETFRGNKSGIDPQEVKAEVTALWQASDSGTSFQAALEERGYLLCKGDRRDFCIVDQSGHEHSLARRISGVKAAEIRARMADVDRDALPSVAEGRAQKTETGPDEGAKSLDLAPRLSPEQAQRAARLAALENEIQPYTQAIERGEEIEPSATWMERTREYLQRFRGAAETAVKKVKDTWAKYVEERRRKDDKEKETSWRQHLDARQREGPDMER